MNGSDRDYQAYALPGVSRTFALTIPALPERLAFVVTNAYLLCRIADTIEDDPGMPLERKHAFLGRFPSVVRGRDDANAFAASLSRELAVDNPKAELELVRNAAKVVRVTQGLADAERATLARCVSAMCARMPGFLNSGLAGLRDVDELDAYCYAVAGTVGEMLLDLFCIRCPDLISKRRTMRRLAVSFGQGLQMTNILKDLWDDRARGACWLPRSVFSGIPVERLEEHRGTGAFRHGLRALVAVAYGHLRNALEFTCHLPRGEVGMRLFCLWALGLAVLTLRRIDRHPHYASADEVKVPRRMVAAVIAATNAAVSDDKRLRRLFGSAARGLPQCTKVPA